MNSRVRTAHAQGAPTLHAPAACAARPPAPVAPLAVSAGASIADEQRRIDAERAKASSPRFDGTRTTWGGDKTKPNPLEIVMWQTNLNRSAKEALGSAQTAKEKTEVIRAVTQGAIRDGGSRTPSERKELVYHLNFHGEVSAEEAAERKRLCSKGTSCLGKEAPPDFSDPQILKGPFRSLGKDYDPFKTPPSPDEAVVRALDESARALRQSVIDAALASDDPEARKAALSLLPPSAFDPHAFFAKDLLRTSTSKTAKDGMKHLGELLKARALGASERWKRYVDSAEIDRKITALLGDKEVFAQIDTLRKSAADATKKSFSYAMHVEHVRSEAFWKRTQLAGEEGGKRIVAEEVAKVAVVDPEMARDLLDQIQDRATADLLTMLPKEELVRRFAAIETDLGGNGVDLAKILEGGLELTKKSADALSAMDAIKAIVKARASRGAAPADAIAALKKTRFAETKVGASLASLSVVDKHGKVSGSLAGLGLVMTAKDLANDKLGEGTKNDVDAMLSVMKAVDAHDAYIKWIAWQAGREVADDAKVLKRLSVLKKLGPAADIIGGVVDGRRAFQNLEAGNDDKAVWQFTAAGGQFLTAAGTIAILAGASGPAAPVVVLVGTAVYLIARAAEASVDKAPEVEFLREADLLAPMPKEVVRERSLLESKSYHERARAQALVNLGNANYKLERPIGARPHDLERARSAAYRAEADAAEATRRIESINAKLATLRAEMASMGINPSDWDGFSDEERRKRRR